jgi:hypothetical protein
MRVLPLHHERAVRPSGTATVQVEEEASVVVRKLVADDLLETPDMVDRD